MPPVFCLLEPVVSFLGLESGYYVGAGRVPDRDTR